jgi:WD repeat-containing protein 19
MSNLQETSSVLTVEEDEVERLSWNEDGQLLGVVTHSGSIYVYLSQLPMIWSVFNTHLAVLTSLTELTVYSYEQDNKVIATSVDQMVTTSQQSCSMQHKQICWYLY